MFQGLKKNAMRISTLAGVLVFIAAAFEIMIMISPFAFFFYSVFNPIFDWLGRFAATSWLTAFFLPHMILPPTFLLQTIRVAGSVLFVLGAVVFIICALQVYLGKIFKWGIADKGLYTYIRHPQYLALGIWGIGMSILWPRFFVLATLTIMFILYYFLAKDEERRMKAKFGESYQAYMNRTGMFFPRLTKRTNPVIGNSPLRNVAVPALIVIVVIGAGFVLRGITLNSLPFESKNNLTVVSILPEDSGLGAKAIDAVLNGKANLSADKDYLGYLMPADYIMQGMIANTGGEFHLFKQHNTFAMITEWVLHPFQHLRSSPSFHMARMHGANPSFARRHHCPLQIDDPSLTCETCPYRRLIIDEVNHDGTHRSGGSLLAFDAKRVPVYAIDIDTRNGAVVKVTPVGKATAWANVPTPAI